MPLNPPEINSKYITSGQLKLAEPKPNLPTLSQTHGPLIVSTKSDTDLPTSNLNPSQYISPVRVEPAATTSSSVGSLETATFNSGSNQFPAGSATNFYLIIAIAIFIIGSLFSLGLILFLFRTKTIKKKLDSELAKQPDSYAKELELSDNNALDAATIQRAAEKYKLEFRDSLFLDKPEAIHE